MHIITLIVLKYLLLDIKQFFLPVWMNRDIVDESHFSHRRNSRIYKARVRVVKYLWILMATITFVMPSPAFLVAGGLFTSFLSFCILDESI